MNMFKKTGGFTLVELIVVIAILAILAGVAVPAYSGYISKAQEAADTTELSAVKTAAMAACATVGEVDKLEVKAGEVKIYVDGTDTADYILTYSSDAWTCTAATDLAADFNAFMNGENVELSYYDSATWLAVAPTDKSAEAGWTGVKAS